MESMTAPTRKNDGNWKASCASTTSRRQKTCATHCSNTLSNETIVYDRLAKNIVSTTRRFLSSSGVEERFDDPSPTAGVITSTATNSRRVPFGLEPLW